MMRSENLDLSLSVPHHYNNNGYIMNDQTFHTPSFGDEEFVDIPPLHTHQQQMSGMQHHQQHLHQYAQHHHGPQVRPSYMGMINPAQDGLLTDGQPSYQQPLYLQPQEHQIHNSTYGSQQPPGNYLIQQQPGGQRLLVMQPPQQPGYGRSPPQPSPATPAGINDTHTTTSEDSDDSTPHHTPMVGVGGAVKRPSPEPVGNEIGHQLPKQLAKKPKVQKKKKKRDPNEPQKPVSAYALFFRDTQAAIKGQNPNASFGEVSKIVASMWDGLDSEHKSVYKQKTEAAKKEYLKALAAYRASLVSKGGSEADGALYGPGGGNGGGGPYGGFYPNAAAAAAAGQGYGGGQSPPAPSRSPLVSPPHHLSMIGMHHTQMPMGPPHHHHQPPYMHHTHQQPPLNSPHQSPQHHMPPGPMGPQAQHMGPQGPPMGTQVQPLGSQNQQMPQSGQSPQQQMNHQQMSQQTGQQMNQQQINQQASQMGQQQSQMGQSPQQVAQQQSQQMVQQGQMNNQNQMCSQNQGLVQNHQMTNQNPQMRSPQGQNVNSGSLGMPNHQSPPHNGQQNQHPAMNPHHQQNGSQQQQQQQSNGTPEGGNGSVGQGRATACIRHGCTNPAIANSEWEDEYCSNECVVSHCRDVFSSWVASNNNQSQNFSAVK